MATDAGEWLQERVPSTALVRTHVDMGESAAAVAVPITVLALLVWWRGREVDAVSNADVGLHQAAPVGGATGSSPTSAVVTTLARTRPPRRAFLAPKSIAVGVVISVLSVVAAGAAVYDIYRIGDSGAQATWSGKVGP